VLEWGLGEDEAMLGELKVGDREDSVFGHSICGISRFTLKLGSGRRSCYEEELKLRDASREGNVAGACLRSARPTLHESSTSLLTY
jgi:hypothetical protein